MGAEVIVKRQGTRAQLRFISLSLIFHKRSAARPESTMPAVLQPQKASSKYFNMSAGFLTL
jgi:hypothetical protein